MEKAGARQAGREELSPGLFLYNNTGEEGQADRTVISLQGAKANSAGEAWGWRRLAWGPVGGLGDDFRSWESEASWTRTKGQEVRSRRERGPAPPGPPSKVEVQEEGELACSDGRLPLRGYLAAGGGEFLQCSCSLAVGEMS